MSLVIKPLLKSLFNAIKEALMSCLKVLYVQLKSLFIETRKYFKGGYPIFRHRYPSFSTAVHESCTAST